ncbi:MAG TPA: efflux RND transporter periplasmic adaptor subunit [Acidiferrobacter sp.]|nr:efflux RND transporter periplasmic adaptor subunit [Acidiferrobacter sp.]
MSRRKRVVLLILIGVVALLGYRLFFRPKKPRPPSPPVPVQVATVSRTNIPISLQALGTVQAYRIVTVEPMISGPMIAVDFHQGHTVRKGQLLAKIDPRPYQAALDQALAKQAQDLATYRAAQDNLKRYDLLIAHHYISAQIVAQQRALVDEDHAIVAQDRAAIETARTNLSYTRITAPISGRTGILAVNAGNIVSPGLAGGIVTITTLQPIYVLFSLPQQDLADVQQALKSGTPRVTALTGIGNQETILGHGTLAVLDNVINASTGTLSLKARFKNPSLTLWPGAFVNVRLNLRTEHNALTVPSLAIHQGPDGPFVYVVQHARAPATANATASRAIPGQDTVVATPVRLGFANQHITVIAAGLQAGEQVVTVGASRLRPNAHIHIVPRASNTGKPTKPV